MAAVRHVGFIVTIIILYRKTEVNALDIVLNFDVGLHRFHTLRYTSTSMFHHFSLKLSILN